MNDVPENLDPYSESRLKLSISKAHRLTAMKLFCCPEFAQTSFREMDLEDWKIHASRAREIADVLVKELKRQKRNRSTASRRVKPD